MLRWGGCTGVRSGLSSGFGFLGGLLAGWGLGEESGRLCGLLLLLLGRGRLLLLYGSCTFLLCPLLRLFVGFRFVE